VGGVPSATGAAVHRFAAERGLELAGPRWEIYGHMSDDPAEIETEIHYLVASPI
jgi:effector-binding domain-containing protein